jgi:uncharacterized protein (TIGR02246 family)
MKRISLLLLAIVASIAVVAATRAQEETADKETSSTIAPAREGGQAAEEEQPAEADTSADEEAIRECVAKYVEAYNRRDSKTMASCWSPEAVYMDPETGEGIVGQDEIAKHFDHQFAGAEDAKLVVVIDSIEFVSPNVAIEKGAATVSYSEFPDEETQYTAVHVRRDGKWMLDRVSEAAVPEPPHSNYKKLKDLEWMIGSWIDEDETSSVQTECQWTKNRNFMTRSFAASVRDEISMSGMQVIGWDPAAKQIRSWVFDSEGGFGEGTWQKKDNQWFITSQGTLADGSQSSAVHIITMIDADSYTWQSIDRQVGGQLMPNLEEVLIVRAPGE